MKHISGEEMEEKEKQKDVGTMKRGRSGDWRVVRKGLMSVASDATWDHGGFRPVLPPRATSGSMAGLGCCRRTC